MPSKIPIPHYGLTPQTTNGVVLVDLSRYEQYSRHAVLEPHRDDHFSLIVIQSGRIELAVDFKSVKITKPTFFLIAPEQVHQLIRMDDVQGWLVNIDRAILPHDLLVHIDHYLHAPLLLEKGSLVTQHLSSLLQTADDLNIHTTNGFIDKTIQTLVNSVISLALSLAESNVPATQTTGRGAALYRQFKALLDGHFKVWKQTSHYAAKMALSPSHLNDTVKAVSGLTVSMHVQERNVLEAKRLLYNTDLTVGEIGFALGYEDPVYFGKLFKKHARFTPQVFRTKFRV